MDQKEISGENEPSLSPELEKQLERLLSRVPPIISLPPPKARCPFTDQPRSSILELIAPCPRNNGKPPVKAIYKKAHKYATRGRWLIPSENLFRYLLTLAEGSSETYVTLAKERRTAKGG